MNKDYRNEKKEFDYGLAYTYLCAPFPDLMVGPACSDGELPHDCGEPRLPRSGLIDIVRRLLASKHPRSQRDITL